MTTDPTNHHPADRAHPVDRSARRPFDFLLSDLSADLSAADERTALDAVAPDVAEAFARLSRPSIPDGLVDRIFATSVAMLPLPQRHELVRASSDSEWSFERASRRWAPRLAMAASIGLALVIATPFAGVLHRPAALVGLEANVMPALFADGGSSAEPMLVALLCDGDGGGCWLEFDAGAEHGEILVADDPEVDSLLASRHSRFADLATEFGRIVQEAPASARDSVSEPAASINRPEMTR